MSTLVCTTYYMSVWGSVNGHHGARLLASLGRWCDPGD
jgi:hypothetical protein